MASVLRAGALRLLDVPCPGLLASAQCLHICGPVPVHPRHRISHTFDESLAALPRLGLGDGEPRTDLPPCDLDRVEASGAFRELQQSDVVCFHGGSVLAILHSPRPIA